MKINAKPKRRDALRLNSHETAGGAPAAHINAYAQLRRSVMSCLLWEDEHYEDGQSIADRIKLHAAHVKPAKLAEIAIEAREVMNLRHVPLWLTVQLCKTGQGNRELVASTIERVIKRGDEPGELLALYWKANGKDAPLSNPLKIGLARALLKFDEYQLAKYAKTGDVRLRDVMFLTHPNPSEDLKVEDRPLLFGKVAEDELSADDAGTWEAKLSAGADKRETFEQLIRDGELGYLALLRNLRNMAGAGCDAALVKEAIRARRGADRVLPFRFIAAARHAPDFTDALNEALIAGIDRMGFVFGGKTVILVDVSSSMHAKLSGKSELTRMDAAAALASVVPAEDRTVITFSSMVAECLDCPRGLAGIDRIIRSQPHQSTRLFEAVQHANDHIPYDRIIVITDEQATYQYGRDFEDRFPSPRPDAKGYLINVASNKNGVGYGKWTHIDGFSENVLRYIAATEVEAGH
jgi:60 kDa SS-A/Ro ribonucleoprotein